MSDIWSETYKKHEIAIDDCYVAVTSAIHPNGNLVSDLDITLYGTGSSFRGTARLTPEQMEELAGHLLSSAVRVRELKNHPFLQQLPEAA